MKRILIPFLILLALLTGCSAPKAYDPIAATTLPVYEFTSRLCEGTDLNVTRLVTESVSCLHDYSLNVAQVRSAEAAEIVVINGAGLEEFMEDILHDKNSIDASSGIEIIECEEGHDHDHEEEHDHEGHHHEQDSHIWLSPENAMVMARNICGSLSEQYPEFRDTFESNLAALLSDLEALQRYGETELAGLSCRELITFHDGFAYFAEAFDLHIIRAVEEESGSEASAAELKELIGIVREHELPAIFTETNGSVSAADVIARETGAAVYTLDMAMSGDSYFEAMYHNIDTIKEALG
ncbi:MAG: zinc ABC transporter substrate-binding protein [Oscillospiraceae bacterium]|nr:zinc ABC transporter substrate-binding protein [Oscillospiraceae bacterium]